MQLDTVTRQFPGALAAGTLLLPDASVLAFIDMDSMQNACTGTPSEAAGPGARNPGARA